MLPRCMQFWLIGISCWEAPSLQHPLLNCHRCSLSPRTPLGPHPQRSSPQDRCPSWSPFPGILPRRSPPQGDCPQVWRLCQGRAHFGTELASFAGVASFPKTSSIIRSSGVALTGSSGGTSAMISATCSVQRGCDKPSHHSAGDRTQ